MKNVARLTIPATPSKTPKKTATLILVGVELCGGDNSVFVLVACAAVVCAVVAAAEVASVVD